MPKECLQLFFLLLYFLFPSLFSNFRIMRMRCVRQLLRSSPKAIKVSYHQNIIVSKTSKYQKHHTIKPDFPLFVFMSARPAIRLFCCTLLLLPSLLGAQTYVRQAIDIDPELSGIFMMKKDVWNRLILADEDRLMAFDGMTTHDMLSMKDHGRVVDIFPQPASQTHLILTDRALLHTKPLLRHQDSIIYKHALASNVKCHNLDAHHLVYQDATDIVHLYDLATKKTITLPYAGGPLDGIIKIDETIYLFGDALNTYKIVDQNYKSVNIELPIGNNIVLHTDGRVYLISENGQFWQIDVPSMKSSFIDRIPMTSPFIGGQLLNTSIFLPSRKNGIVQYEIEDRRLSFLHVGNGLCHNTISCFYLENERNLWTSNGSEVCLSQNKFPIVVDRDFGLKDDRIVAVEIFDEDIYFSTRATGFYKKSDIGIKYFGPANDFIDSRVLAFENIGDGRMLMATAGSGLVEFDKNEHFYYLDSSTFYNQKVTALVSATDNNVYVGTASQGLWQLEKDSVGHWSSRRLFPTRITSVVDIITIFDGGALIAQDDEINYFDNHTGKLESIFTTKDLVSIKDIALWDGWIYAVTHDELIRIPMKGMDDRVEHFDESGGLRSTNIQSVHAVDNVVLVTDRQGTMHYPIDYLNIPEKNTMPVSDNYKITKNGLVTNSQNHQSFVATDRGLVRLVDRPQMPLTGKLILEKVSVNDVLYTSVEGRQFEGRQNQWLISYFSIAPEHKGALSYYWLLNGKHHKFEGKTDQRSIYFPFLPPDEYTLSIRGTGDRLQTNVLQQSFTIKPRFYNTQRFRLLLIGSAIFMLGLLSFIISKMMSARLNKRNKQLKRENEMLEWQQKALQLQMNPHFIFNALNSIQSLVGKDDRQARYYIAKLGKLMRTTLHHAREKWISIGDEIELLTAYLELEKLNHGFTYSINKNNIEDHIYIPPMMLQPLVENAIKHGVSKLKEEGQVAIDFRYDGRKIKCTVRDNGPGSQSNEQSKDHVSVSTRVINDRMAIYQKEGVKVDPIRIVFSEGDALYGTEVHIGLPYVDRKLEKFDE